MFVIVNQHSGDQNSSNENRCLCLAVDFVLVHAQFDWALNSEAAQMLLNYINLQRCVCNIFLTFKQISFNLLFVCFTMYRM